MKKTVVFVLVCLFALLASCSGGAGAGGSVLPDDPLKDPPVSNGPTEQQPNDEQPEAEDGDEEQEDKNEQTPPTESDQPSAVDEPDVYILQSEQGKEVLTIDFYEGTYTLEVNTTLTGSYTAEGNCVTLAIFDPQNTWTVQNDGSMTAGHDGEWAELSTGIFSGESAYGEYTLTLHDDGTFLLEQNEISTGSYLIVDGYTILKRERYGEENLYLIADNETDTFYYTE